MSAWQAAVSFDGKKRRENASLSLSVHIDDNSHAPMTDSISRDAAFERDALVCLPELARFARTLARDSVDAEDLVQETFLRAYAAWDQFERGTICRNIFLRATARAKRVVASDDPEAESLASAVLYHHSVEGKLDDMFGRFDLRDALLDAIRLLNEEHRVVVALVDAQGLSYLDAANALDIPVGTVRSRLFRARRLLQAHLVKHAEDAGIVTTAHSLLHRDTTRAMEMEGGV
jgi:RNA polymerase sigma-70 factor (ECF subfamily)